MSRFVPIALLLVLALLPACGTTPAPTPEKETKPPAESKDAKPPNDEEAATKVAKALNDAKALADCVERYYVDRDAYPNNLDDLAKPPEGLPYAAAEKLIDPWGKKYQFSIVADEKGVQRTKVFTTGPDGKEISNFSRPPEKKK